MTLHLTFDGLDNMRGVVGGDTVFSAAKSCRGAIRTGQLKEGRTDWFLNTLDMIASPDYATICGHNGQRILLHGYTAEFSPIMHGWRLIKKRRTECRLKLYFAERQ